MSRLQTPARYIRTTAFLLAFSLHGFAQDAGRIRVERTAVEGGGELLTWFERLPPGAVEISGRSEMPILAALNDRLMSPETGDDRLRQVWAFTYIPPSVVQRLESTIPFLYYRVDFGHDTASSKPPRPVFDLGDPSRGVGQRIAMAIAQSELINPAGSVARLTSRSYGGNLAQYRAAHIWEALDLISEKGSGHASGMTQDESQLLQSRLELNDRLLGGLVSDDALPQFYDKLQTERSEVRGHNWELLRQAAENTGLYFQPLSVGGSQNAFAMLWIARNDLESRSRQFDSRFLRIENPFTDEHLRHWTGYSQTWTLDEKPSNMIPLALYSLDYPGVPFLLIDFRRTSVARRSEMAMRFADDFTAGVLGYTGFGHLGFMALKTSWLFVSKRHGGATNRAARSRAFIQLRHALGVDDSLDPVLRAQLSHRLEQLDVDPIERTWTQEVAGAWKQYEALLKSAGTPQGLPRTLQSDREQEARAAAHNPGARAVIRLASAGSLGLYRHRDGPTPDQVNAIAESRKEALLRRTPAAPQPATQTRALVTGTGE